MQASSDAGLKRRSMAYWRRVKGVRQKDIAEPLGITRQAVSEWERGTAKPNIEQARVVADVLGVPLDWIEFGPEQPQRAPMKAPVHDHVAV